MLAIVTAGLPSLGDLMAWALLKKVGSDFDATNPFCMTMFFYLPAVVDLLSLIALLPIMENTLESALVVLFFKTTPLAISATSYLI